MMFHGIAVSADFKSTDFEQYLQSKNRKNTRTMKRIFIKKPREYNLYVLASACTKQAYREKKTARVYKQLSTFIPDGPKY